MRWRSPLTGTVFAVTRLRHRLALGLVACVALPMLTSCGDDPVSRGDFIQQLIAVTSGPDKADEALAGCIYDAIAGDSQLLETASRSTSLNDTDDARLSSITKVCRTGIEQAKRDAANPTTTEASPTTIDSPS